MADTAACPSCQAKLVAHVALPWGDGAQRLPAARHRSNRKPTPVW